MRNLIVDIGKDGKHFLIGVTLDFNVEGNHENSVSGLFPKEDHEWIKWIQDGKHIRIDQKDKVQSIISSLRTNPAESTRIGLNLESIAKIINEFENPTIPEEKNEENSAKAQYSLQGNSMTEEEQRIVDEAKANGTFDASNPDIRYSLASDMARDAVMTAFEGVGIDVERLLLKWWKMC